MPRSHRTCCFNCRFRAVAALLLLPCLPSAAAAANPRGAISPDGAWCWFSDPRALCIDGTVYTGWVTADGDVEAAACDMNSGVVDVGSLCPDFQADDHVNPAFYHTSDGRLTAFYSQHAVSGSYTQYRISLLPHDITEWLDQRSTNANASGRHGSTYSNPIAAPGAADTIYFFWRGANRQPNFSIGRYSAADTTWSWSAARTLIYSESNRPYVKYARGQGIIGFAFTNGHPLESDAMLYYASIGEAEGGEPAYLRSDGTTIKLLDAGPLLPSEAELIYDGSASPNRVPIEAWVWDFAFDETGTPTVAYVSFPSLTRHTYHWAQCRDGVWTSTTLVEDAGGSVADTTIASPQYYYSGGLALDHTDVSTVYLSRKNEMGGWDLERWKTADEGRTWRSTTIAGGTTEENLRPVVPRGLPRGRKMVLWMSGRYDYYANDVEGGTYNYDTAVHIWFEHELGGTPVVAYPEQPVPTRCYPNPSTGNVSLSFDLIDRSRVCLSVHDVAGRKVAELLDQQTRAAGVHSVIWNGHERNGRPVSSGVYFARLDVDGRVSTSKIVIVR